MSSVRGETSLGTYRVLFIVALGIGLVTSAQHFVMMQIDGHDPAWRSVHHALSKEMPWWLLWVAAAPLTVRANRLVPLLKDRLFVSVPIHVLLALLVAGTHAALVLAAHRILRFPTGPQPYWTTYRGDLPLSLTSGLLGYALMFGTIVAVDHYRRYRDAEARAAMLGREIAETRLEALRTRLDPDFVFDAMNTISLSIQRQETPSAVKMLARLSELLRLRLGGPGSE